MFHLIDNLNPLLITEFNSTIEKNSYPDAFGNVNAAHRITQATSGFFYAFTFSAYTEVQVQSREIICSVSIGNLVNVNTMSFFLAFHSGAHLSSPFEAITPPANGFQTYTFKTISASLEGGFRVAIRPSELLDTSVTRRFDIFGEYVIIDSLNAVYLQPEYEAFKLNDKKLEGKHRTPIGKKGVYKWGDYESIELDVLYISSGVREVINSYWNTNAELLFVQSGATKVSSVRMINKNTPINAFIQPYNDLSQGTIELETY